MNMFIVGERVKATKGSHKSDTGIVEKVIAVPWAEAEYQVGFSTKPYGMTLLESSLQGVLYTENIAETVKRIGAIGTAFTEADIVTIGAPLIVV